MKVKFLPMDVEFDIEPNQSVMKLAHEKGVKIKSVCNGLPSCAECRVKLVEGEHNVLPPSAKELSLIGTGHFIDQRRLSCQLMCFGDITVDLTEQMDKVITDQQRRPQGTLRKDDSEVSRAITGNLIKDEEQIFEKMESAQKVESRPPRHQQREERPNNKNKRPNRRNKSHKYRPKKSE